MIRMLAGLEEDAIAGNHVVDDVALRDLLRAERLRGGEIHAVVVAQMVVAHYGRWLQFNLKKKKRSII